MIIQINGEPIPLQRARASKNRFYDPQYTAKKNFASEVQRVLLEYVEGFEPFATPIKVAFDFALPIPKSWSKKKQHESIGKPHIGKKDLSNYIKFVEDALNGIVWHDDCIIWQISATKYYEEEPKTIITIEE